MMENIVYKEFARVSDKYYQYISDANGCKVLKYRDKQELKQDRVSLTDIPTYHGFTVSHNFQNHQPIINGWLNLSMPLQWTSEGGDFTTISLLLKHIFGEQIQMGLDYFQLLLQRPKQLLPILVLASAEQGTGKTSLLNFIEMLFGSNAVILNVSQYCQQFNGLFASKLVIGIDETSISEKFIKERLKLDSTARTLQLRKMHADFESIPFYGKFILCTNEEDTFVKLDNNDMRFWIRKVGRVEKFDSDFENKLKKEIPAFLYFISNRKLSVPTSLSRQWFTKEQLHTDALDVIIKESISKCAKDIQIWGNDIISESGKTYLYATATNITNELRRYSQSEIVRALKKELGLFPQKQMRYTGINGLDCNGKPYMLELSEK